MDQNIHPQHDPAPNSMPAKTYKRETAAAMLVFYYVMVVIGMQYPPAAEAAAALKYEVFAFAGIAFGIDAWAKQVRPKT